MVKDATDIFISKRHNPIKKTVLILGIFKPFVDLYDGLEIITCDNFGRRAREICFLNKRKIKLPKSVFKLNSYKITTLVQQQYCKKTARKTI